MKKATITLALLFASLIGFSQNKTAKGTVLDINNQSVIQKAVIKLNDTSIYTYTNDLGQFSIEIPKSFHTLTIQHNDYLQKKIRLNPGFQRVNTEIYLQPKNFKVLNNNLSLSVLELFLVAIAGNYEHVFSEKQSIGAYLSIYVYGKNPFAISENDYWVVYQGFKFAPDYRFYPIKNNRKFFIEGKLQVGYINFSKLEYQWGSYSSYQKNIHYSFWTGGFGASVGVKLPAKKGRFTFVAGYQYFPINVPESIEVEFPEGSVSHYTTNTDWWYQTGPGTPFVFKVLIGGAF